MCARLNAAGNIEVDPNNGNLYLTFADNRNGTASNTNTDVLVVRSTDGGRTWSTPLNTTARTALPFWTGARFAEPNVQGNNPPRQQSDVMTDVEPLR